jgi:1,4-alpha-glucan branching enzyme
MTRVHDAGGNEQCRYREWAPGAQAIALVGEFNNWDPAPHHWALKDEFGNFNLFIADPSPGVSAVPHRCCLTHLALLPHIQSPLMIQTSIARIVP